MSDRKRGLLFLSMAEKDLDAVDRMRRDEGFAEEVFGLHAQQAVEKALKAWLCLTESRVPRIHDLEQLMVLLVEQDQAIPESAQSLVELSDFATQFRYEPYADFGRALERCDITQQISAPIECVRARFKQENAERGDR